MPYDLDVICNICSKPPTWLQKVEYLLNKSTDLNEILNLSSGNRQWLPKNFRKDPCLHVHVRGRNVCLRVHHIHIFLRIRTAPRKKIIIFYKNILASKKSFPVTNGQYFNQKKLFLAVWMPSIKKQFFLRRSYFCQNFLQFFL